MQSEPKMMKSSKLPIQAAPVQRNITGVSMSSQNGVDPSVCVGLSWRETNSGPNSSIIRGISGIGGNIGSGIDAYIPEVIHGINPIFGN